MRKFAVGVLLGIAVTIFGLILYFATGLAPVSTSAPEMPFEKRLAKMALHARLRREMPSVVSIKDDDANLAAGAKLYRENCSVCHGLPQQPASSVARGMFPPPPQLFVKTVTHDPPGEIYWKTRNGIRLTGMPGFERSLTDPELWQVSLVLKHTDALPVMAQTILGAQPNVVSGR
jgi:thiosulfate dehydrogenase